MEATNGQITGSIERQCGAALPGGWSAVCALGATLVAIALAHALLRLKSPHVFSSEKCSLTVGLYFAALPFVCFCAGFWTPAMMRCLALRRAASKKRQGTKSREVWRRLCRERYGDLIFAPAVMVGAMPAPGDLDRCAQGSLEARNGYLGGRVDLINGQSAR
jgi:hypothetical protein